MHHYQRQIEIQLHLGRKFLKDLLSRALAVSKYQANLLCRPVCQCHPKRAIRGRAGTVVVLQHQCPRSGSRSPPTSLRCLSRERPARACARGSAAGPVRALNWGKPQPPRPRAASGGHSPRFSQVATSVSRLGIGPTRPEVLSRAIPRPARQCGTICHDTQVATVDCSELTHSLEGAKTETPQISRDK